MQIRTITDYLEKLYPLAYQEDYDNCGYIVGDNTTILTGILITLDCTEVIVEEAVRRGCNLIIAHHPILFKAVKKISNDNYVGRTIVKAIRHDVVIYAAHTNLDNIATGVNMKIAQKLGLVDTHVLVPKSNQLKKLLAFVPQDHTEKLLQALYQAGAGNIGNYSECSFTSSGIGNFKPNEGATPAIGQVGTKEFVTENKIEVLFPNHLERKIVEALRETHPYEVPAYDIIPLANEYSEVGSGMIGKLESPLTEKEFLHHLKKSLNLSLIRHSEFINKTIFQVALCGGSGSFLLKAAIRHHADAFISSDFKYHEFFDAENKILIADINHYEGEVYTKDLIFEQLTKNFSNIAIVLSQIETNPISYF